MRIDIACFSGAGMIIAERLGDALEDNAVVSITRCGNDGPTVGEWTARVFTGSDGVVFVGAVGIAVRAIASHIKTKSSDPAVIVIDDTGRYVIPILSGHIGGANRLAGQFAKLLSAEAVITAATDRRGVFAFDSWAAAENMCIRNPAAIKSVAAAMLRGEVIRLYAESPIAGALPGQVVLAESPAEADVIISHREQANTKALLCIPPMVTVGVGCRQGKEAESLETMVGDVCRSAGICVEAIEQVASIDLKKDEPGLLALCQRCGWLFRVFSATVLSAVAGDFSSSEFVREHTGVDNVCERAAVAASGGVMVAKKCARDGMTVALAVHPYTVRFEG